jgi:hypothetical protein
MPLLEVTQTKQISASVRLSESTATQVDQYAAYIQATGDAIRGCKEAGCRHANAEE